MKITGNADVISRNRGMYVDSCFVKYDSISQ